MSKKFLNTCMDCKTVTDRALWKVVIINGPIRATEKFNVGPEFGPEPEHFELDTIDANELVKKYKITADRAEEAILNGEPLCPKCESEHFYTYCEETDKQYLK